MDLLGICGGLIMDWTPDKYFIMKDWGINPYDPTDTFDGLRKLPHKELKRLSKALQEIGLNCPLADRVGHELNKESIISNIMGVIYFNNVYHFVVHNITVSDWVNKYLRTANLLNWSGENFVTMMRKEGLFMARMIYEEDILS
tara:strand:+ start:115 stop:543 length:429 start_codon:yes stop_codon:yes gene_type:complete